MTHFYDPQQEIIDLKRRVSKAESLLESLLERIESINDTLNDHMEAEDHSS
jgi:uncharacterized protein involved in exopolysaccharide biosynthesis